MTNLLQAVLFIYTVFFNLGCDPERRSQCEWTLEPETRPLIGIDENMIHVCARNRNSGKQDCRLQISLENAKIHYGKHFKYNDMQVDGPGIPRTVIGISYCKPTKQ